MSVKTGTIVKIELVEEYVYSEGPPRLVRKNSSYYAPRLVRGPSYYGAFNPEECPESGAEYIIGEPYTTQTDYSKQWNISRRDGSTTPMYILIQDAEGKYFTCITQVGFKPKPVLVEVV